MYNKSVIQLIDLRKSYGDVEVLKELISPSRKER